MIANLHAYILAGGRSSRFGSDKARATFEGEPLIARTARALANECCAISVVAQRQGIYDDLGLRTIADHQPDRGPLAGLLRALDDLSETSKPSAMSDRPGSASDTAWALVVSCDLVQWEPAWLSALVSARDPTLLAIAFRTDRWQPFPGLYRPSLAATIRSRLQTLKPSMQGLLDDPTSRAAALELDQLPPIRCANSLDELRRFELR